MASKRMHIGVLQPSQPVLPVTLWNGTRAWVVTRQQEIRQVLSDDEHPLRVAVAVFVISDINGKQQVTTQEELRTIRAAYNRVMNKALGFYKIEMK